MHRTRTDIGRRGTGALTTSSKLVDAFVIRFWLDTSLQVQVSDLWGRTAANHLPPNAGSVACAVEPDTSRAGARDVHSATVRGHP